MVSGVVFKTLSLRFIGTLLYMGREAGFEPELVTNEVFPPFMYEYNIGYCRACAAALPGRC
jgi:hypothetical protein